jgi:hypothetical protein
MQNKSSRPKKKFESVPTHSTYSPSRHDHRIVLPPLKTEAAGVFWAKFTRLPFCFGATPPTSPNEGGYLFEAHHNAADIASGLVAREVPRCRDERARTGGLESAEDQGKARPLSGEARVRFGCRPFLRRRPRAAGGKSHGGRVRPPSEDSLRSHLRVLCSAGEGIIATKAAAKRPTAFTLGGVHFLYVALTGPPRRRHGSPVHPARL